MARAEPGPVVAVEVFVEEDVVAPVRVILELRSASVDRPPSASSLRKMLASRRAISSATPNRCHPLAGAGGALDGEVVAVETGRGSRSPRTMSTLTGIQIGPRQFELPPNIPVFDSAGT